MQVFLRIFLLLFVLVVGIFIGVNTAEENIQQMQGNEGAPKAIQITPQDGKIEISVLGQVVEAKNPTNQIGKEQVLQMKNQVSEETNRLSEIGNFLGTEVRKKARGLLGWMFDWLS